MSDQVASDLSKEQLDTPRDLGKKELKDVTLSKDLSNEKLILPSIT